MAAVAPRTIIITKMPNRSSGLPPRMLVTATPAMPIVVGNVEGVGSRKRRRLTHLSADERMMRRKLKNRVAAQTARDRKKQRMDELEEALAELEAENQHLQMQNKDLIEKSQHLNQENLVLREHLGLDDEGRIPATEISSTGGVMSVKSEPGSPESAAGTDPDSLHSSIALHGHDSDSQSDIMLQLLEQVCGGPGSQAPAASDREPTTSEGQTGTTCDVVGPTSAELESINELIRFDHIYYKSSEKPASSPRLLPHPLQKKSENTVDTTLKPADPKSVFPRKGKRQSAVSILKIKPNDAVPNTCETSTNSSSSGAPETEGLEDGFSLDISEIDFDNLDELLNFEQLLESACIKVEDCDTPGDEGDEDSCIVIDVDDEPTCKRRKTVEDSCTVSSQPPILNTSKDSRSTVKEVTGESPSFFDELSFTTIEPTSPLQSIPITDMVKPSLTESGYGSDVGSPKSDISTFLDDGDNIWAEETLSDLFPALL